MKKHVSVLYLCDGQACKTPYVSCKEDGCCQHTTDPSHAVNGPCAHPENDPERFEKHNTHGIVVGDCLLELYVEKETVRPNEIRIGDMVWYYQCPSCLSDINRGAQRCPGCGRPVKWE